MTRGRPPRAEGTATKVLRVRLTDEEWARYEAAAEQGDTTLSEMARIGLERVAKQIFRTSG